jgi:predicted CoA-binding protein
MDQPSDDHLRTLLTRARTIAVVGVSMNEVRPSFYVARYLSLRGKRVIPVNPGHAGETLFGETVRASLADCPPDTDMLDVFRRSDHVPPIVGEALEILPKLQTVWLQIGVESDAARDLCAAKGVDFIQNRCPKIEYQRLFGELRQGGFNTGIISSRL